jgi:ParB-like chromosome segregation protein Spo0J
VTKRNLKIDPEIQAALDPLKPAELKQLMENILAEGIRDPLVVWKGKDIIVDGHNRYDLIQKFGLDDYQVVEMEFEDTYDAIDWLRKNQLGKRNLTENQQAFLVGDLYNRRKRKRGGTGANQYSEEIRQVDGLAETAEIVAKEIEVSPRTVERAGEFARVLDVIREKAGPEIVVEIKKRPEKIPTQQLEFLAAEVEHNPQIIEQSLSTPPKLRAKANSLYRGTIYNKTKPKMGTTGFSGETIGIPAKEMAARFGIIEKQMLEDGRFANVINKVRIADPDLCDWLMETPGVPIHGITRFNGDTIDLDLIKSVRSIMETGRLKFDQAYEKATDDQPDDVPSSDSYDRVKKASRNIARAVNEADRETPRAIRSVCLMPNARELFCEDCQWGFDTFLPEPGPVSCPYCKGNRIVKRIDDWSPDGGGQR